MAESPEEFRTRVRPDANANVIIDQLNAARGEPAGRESNDDRPAA